MTAIHTLAVAALISGSTRGLQSLIREAVTWFRKAAVKGNALAQLNLGFMYANGFGVSQDYVQAHMWYELATSRLPPRRCKPARARSNSVAWWLPG